VIRSEQGNSRLGKVVMTCPWERREIRKMLFSHRGTGTEKGDNLEEASSMENLVPRKNKEKARKKLVHNTRKTFRPEANRLSGSDWEGLRWGDRKP